MTNRTPRSVRDRLSTGERSYLSSLGTSPLMRGSKSHVRARPPVTARPITLPHIPFLDDESAAIDARTGPSGAHREPPAPNITMRTALNLCEDSIRSIRNAGLIGAADPAPRAPAGSPADASPASTEP